MSLIPDSTCSILCYNEQLNPEYPQKGSLTLDVENHISSPTSTLPPQAFGATTGTPDLSNVNANCEVFTLSSSRPILRRNNYQRTTSSDETTLRACSGVCVVVGVVAIIVISCFSFGLFLCLGKGCRRNIYRWIRNYHNGQQRTNPPLVMTAPIQLNPRSSQVLTASTELLPLPPYPEDRLPPYSNDAPANNTGVNADSQTEDDSSNTTLTSQFSIPPADTNSVTSANTTMENDNELPVPPTTIPLPPLSSGDHSPRRDSSSG